MDYVNWVALVDIKVTTSDLAATFSCLPKKQKVCSSRQSDVQPYIHVELKSKPDMKDFSHIITDPLWKLISHIR